MYVIKRGNRGREEVRFDKITARLKPLCVGLSPQVDPILITQETIKSIYSGISTAEVDRIAASKAEQYKLVHPDYGVLASRICVSNLHRSTPVRFSEAMEIVFRDLSILDPAYMAFIRKHANSLDWMILHNNDYQYDYFGFSTLEHNYLIKVGDRVVDRPQYMYMRVAIAIHVPPKFLLEVEGSYGGNISEEDARLVLEKIKICYKALSQMYFTHATPTLFNSCMKIGSLSSCFLLGTDDSIEGIMKTLTDASLISKKGGGLGIHMSNIRGEGAIIRGTNGKSTGLPRQLKLYNEAARCWNQGGKRLGAFAIYLAIWHRDVFAVVEMKLQNGAETARARDLFYALWVPDLFFQRAERDEQWSLFSPDVAPGLSDVYDGIEQCTECSKYRHQCAKKCIGDVDHRWIQVKAFTELYLQYEKEKRFAQQVSARTLLNHILASQRESGTPYIMASDSVNRRSNQSNIGTIRSSNLCVAPETFVLTDQGQKRIIDLVDQKVNVWNGEEFSSVTVKKTGENQPLIRVNLSNGVSLECTPYHKFYVVPKFDTRNVKQIEAKDLQSDMKLLKYNLPIIKAEGQPFKYPYTHGLFCADGTYEGINKDTPRITLCDEKKKLASYIDARLEHKESPNGTYTIRLPHDIAAKFVVPSEASLKDKVDWFAGYCDGDGTVVRNGSNQSIQVGSINKNFLLEIRLMLQTIGVDSEVTLLRDAGVKDLPDGTASYMCQALYRLLIGSSDVQLLLSLGFEPHRLQVVQHRPNRNASQFIKVVSVEDHGRVSDTYCFTEPKRNMGMFNGILTGNCTEIVEWSSSESYATCTLAGLNLKKYILPNKTYDFDKLHEMTRLLVRNLDHIIDVNKYPVKECRTNTVDYRPLGVGIQGLADVFCEFRYPFLSKEAEKLDLDIAETMYHAALTESCLLAQEKGPYSAFRNSPASEGKLQFDLWAENNAYLQNGLPTVPVLSGRYNWDILKGQIRQHGLRNSLLLAHMPTVSTSQIMGNNESFEPYSANIYAKTALNGTFTVTNSAMIRHLCELGLWNNDLMNTIITNEGSIQNIPSIPVEVQEIYRTVWEIPQKELMMRTAHRTAFVDQAASLNIHLRDNSSATLRSVMMSGWKLGLKTISYYIRTPPATSALKNNLATSSTSSTTMVKSMKRKLSEGSSSLPKIIKVVPLPEEEEREACEIGCTSCKL